MKNMKHLFSFLTLVLLLSGCTQKEIKAPEPIGPLPTPQQVAWNKLETYAFVHFSLNTFNDLEWGYGDTDPKTFNPTHLDCEQWVKTFKAAGMKGVVITAKHHDGFCLWPTKLTEYCIRNTPYKDGKGDIIGELSAACKKYDLKFGIYLSPWDRNYAEYGTPAYLDYYYAQLKELLTNYGEIFEVWLDGANGGDGYYGGAKEKRSIDGKTYYNFPKIHQIVHELQSNAIIFSDAGPGCRWIGNERGFANATNWSFLHSNKVYPGYPKADELTSGHADGDTWVGAECDVSIRPGWFFHESQNDQVKTVDQLTDLYYRSVGHNANLILNMPINKEGLISKTDSTNLVQFRRNIEKQLADNLLKGIVPDVSNERGGAYVSKALTDDNYDTYWATDDNVINSTITFKLPKKEQVNRMMLQEYIPLGQRVKVFTVEYNDGNKWLPVQMNEETTTIGYKRLLRFKTVITDRLRVTINDSRACPCLNNIEAFYAGETTDVSFDDQAKDIQSLNYKVLNVEEMDGDKIKDKNSSTVLLVDNGSVTLDLGKSVAINSFLYLPDISGQNKGSVDHYTIQVGDSETPTQIVAEGEFANIKSNPILQIVHFTPVKARYIKFSAKSLASEGPMAIAEIGIK
ncbi:alpha-L-fucosidase [Phocaeicola oris]|uniref:alpha-L-fucosidase n=1 Tax=Phocaeicola oris TaxID=2896850 RepID=UPI00234EFB6C|nr:alpha-L-fucosidase [Phocaeicola oris]MCE2617484.1 alpha-L-fucosidase [Phocaeicola oris]